MIQRSKAHPKHLKIHQCFYHDIIQKLNALYLLTQCVRAYCTQQFRLSSGIQMVLGIIKHSLFQESWRRDACWDFCWIVGLWHCRRIRARLPINKAKMQQMHQSETCRSHTYKDPAHMVDIHNQYSQKDMTTWSSVEY